MRLISSFEFKQRLLAERGRFRNNSPFEGGVRHGIRIALRCMERSGSYSRVEAEPVKQGRWLPCGFGKEIMCSVCGCELKDNWEYRHCPDCGAKMDKED